MPSRKKRIEALNVEIAQVQKEISELSAKSQTINTTMREDAEAREKAYNEATESYQEQLNKVQQEFQVVEKRYSYLAGLVTELESNLNDTKQALEDVRNEAKTLSGKEDEVLKKVQGLVSTRDKKYNELAKEAIRLISEKAGHEEQPYHPSNLTSILRATHTNGTPT